ncbi:hypothetical protein D9M68_545710 [compost metagenome]
MRTRGSRLARSPLPSLVTRTWVPSSAMRKLAPVMPTSASRKRWRSSRRASASRSAGSCRKWSRPRPWWCWWNSSCTCLSVLWMAGPLIWLGGSSANWRMYSPRSVSKRWMPARARAELMPISSPIMVLPLITWRAPARRQMATTWAWASSGVAAQCTWIPRRAAAAS